MFTSQETSKSMQGIAKRVDSVVDLAINDVDDLDTMASLVYIKYGVIKYIL